MTPAEFKKLSPSGKPERKREEEHAQMAVMDWVTLHESKYPALQMLFHSPNGGHRDIRVAVKMKRMGVRRGVPDLLLPVIKMSSLPPIPQWHGLAIEMKSGKGSTTDQQDEWLVKLREQGWQTKVAHDAPEAIKAIKEYLGIP
jgi:hypothetical protein